MFHLYLSVIPQQFALNNISSETTGRISTKFVLEHPGTDVYKSYSNHDPMVKVKVTVAKIEIK
jgi:hypothetical protein